MITYAIVDRNTRTGSRDGRGRLSARLRFYGRPLTSGEHSLAPQAAWDLFNQLEDPYGLHAMLITTRALPPTSRPLYPRSHGSDEPRITWRSQMALYASKLTP